MRKERRLWYNKKKLLLIGSLTFYIISSICKLDRIYFDKECVIRTWKKINRNLKENDTILDKEDKDVVKYSNFEEDESNNNNELIYNY